MHPPLKQVSQEEMWQTLAKHAKPQVSVKPLPAVPSPKEKSAPLEWLKPVRTSDEGAGYVQTVCGRFSVSKDGNKTDGFTYTAWRRHPDVMEEGKLRKVMPDNLGCTTDREQAKAWCEAAQ